MVDAQNWFDSRTGDETKGGEALAEAAIQTIENEPSSRAGLGWYVLWTHSHCEQLVYDQLAVKGFELFLPTIDAWSRRFGVRRLARAPLFGGYLFLHHAMDKSSYLEVRKARGLVRVLGERWDRLDVVRIPISGKGNGYASLADQWLTWRASWSGATRTRACW